jgi:hypothetical protein
MKVVNRFSGQDCSHWSRSDKGDESLHDLLHESLHGLYTGSLALEFHFCATPVAQKQDVAAAANGSGMPKSVQAQRFTALQGRRLHPLTSHWYGA